MKKLEITIAILSAIVVVLKILHIPFAGILTMIILFIFSMSYYFLGFAVLNNIRLKDILKKDAYQATSHLRIVGTVYFGFALGTTIYGILMEVIYNQGRFILIVGLCYLFIVAVVALVKYLKTHSQFYIEALVRIAIIGGIGLFFLLY